MVGHAFSSVAVSFAANPHQDQYLVPIPVDTGEEMQLRDFVKGCLEQHYNAMTRSVDGLSQDELAWMPTPECSSIGFLVWHYGRTLDRWIHSRLQDVPQLWEQGWAERLGQQHIGADDTGFGYGPEELASFSTPDGAVMLQYARAALDAANQHLDALGDAEFDGIEVLNPRGGSMTLANMCQQLLWEFNQHGGQIAYLRGMQRGLEDPRYSGGLLEGLAARR